MVRSICSPTTTSNRYLTRTSSAKLFDYHKDAVYDEDMYQLSQALEKEIRSMTSRHGRKKSDKVLIEGVRSISAMIERDVTPECIVVSPRDLSEPGNQFLKTLASKRISLFECDAKRFTHLSDTEHSQGIIALVNRDSLQAPEAAWRRIRLAVYLDKVADPGNVGTIIRTSAALGVSLIALSPGCADIANPKVLRSTAGAVFAMPIATEISAETLAVYLKSNQVELIGADGDGSVEIDSFEPKSKLCIALGAEAEGLSWEIQSICNPVVKIPIAREVESLNVASAAAILIYQMSQKMKLL